MTKIVVQDNLRLQLGEDTVEAIMGIGQKVYNRHPTIFDKCADQRSTNKRKVELVMNKSLGYAGTTTEGAQMSAPNKIHQLWITSAYIQDYEMNYRITWAALKALDRAGKIKKVIEGTSERALALAMKKDRAFCAMLNSYDSGNYGDGLTLGSTAQQAGDGSTYSNLAPAAASISTTAIEAADKAIMQWVDTGGKAIKPEIVRLISHTDQKYNIARVLESEFQPGGNLNDKNVVRSQKVLPQEPQLSPHIANDGSWFLQTDIPDGLLTYTFAKPEFMMLPIDQSRDSLFASFESYVHTVGEKRSLYIFPRT